ncbi:AAA family ATPase [Streptomyces sp. NPDC051445]|uniref:AAA family ATPase n=1 Tax=Streptomyces sp. NPDC051445 TaxID=3365653 RepID=UPI0037B52B50
MAKFGTRQHERSGGSSREAFRQRDLYGRRQGQAALDRILDAARQGRGATMVLWGDPGIGKTVLLEYAAESAAADFTVLRCGGIRLGSGLTFAALHELLCAGDGADRHAPGAAGQLLPPPVDGGGGLRAAFCSPATHVSTVIIQNGPELLPGIGNCSRMVVM